MIRTDALGPSTTVLYIDDHTFYIDHDVPCQQALDDSIIRCTTAAGKDDATARYCIALVCNTPYPDNRYHGD